jgi:hypothetical protein
MACGTCVAIKMKKHITALVLAAILGVMTPLAATAQTRSYNSRYRDSRQSQTYYDNGYYNTDTYSPGKPNVYQRHRKAVNIAVATGVGAIIGALLGGKKGALIGAGAGAVGGVIVTKKHAPKNYYRYY